MCPAVVRSPVGGALGVARIQPSVTSRFSNKPANDARRISPTSKEEG
jgi:hypothetical protein